MNNYHDINLELEQHQLPMTGVRNHLADAVRAYRASWARRIYLQHSSDVGLIRVGMAGIGWENPDKWATANSVGIGEIGVVGTEQGEVIVWRNAFGYGPRGGADNNQVWRAADSGREAVALLMEAFMRNIVTEDHHGRYYAAAMLRSLPCDEKRWPEKALQKLALHAKLCLTHRNSVRRPAPNQQRRSFLDPKTGLVTNGVALRHTRKWYAEMFHTKCSGAGTRAFVWSAGTWNVRWIRARSYCVFVDNDAREWAVVYGSAIPAYVREAVELTQGDIMWFPSKAREGASWNQAINDYLKRNRSGHHKQVAAPTDFYSYDNEILKD